MNELELYIEEGPNSGFRKILVTDAAHPYASGWWPPGHIIGYEHTFTHTVLDLLKAIEEQKLAAASSIFRMKAIEPCRIGFRSQSALADE